MPKIIAVSREFGSGGREFAKRLADELGYKYYDKEIITEIAKRADMDETHVANVLESSVFSQIPLTFAHSFADYAPLHANTTLFGMQNAILKEIAKQGDCVIVGYSANYVLREFSPFSIHVYATTESKLNRCKARAEENEHFTDKQLIKKMKKLDKARAQNHNLFSSTKWGDKNGYNLLLNTTNMEIKKLIPPVAEFIKNWFEN